MFSVRMSSIPELHARYRNLLSMTFVLNATGFASMPQKGASCPEKVTGRATGPSCILKCTGVCAYS